MKKEYIVPLAYNVLGENILYEPQPQTGSSGDSSGQHDGQAKENMLVWDDDFDDDDNWGYSGF